MPTENRSSNIEQMVSVPRDEVERLVKLLQYQAHPYPSPHAEFWQGLLDAPIAQHQSEPVAWRGINELGEVATDWIDGEPPEQMVDLIGKPASFAKIELAYLHPPTSEGFSAGDMADQGAKAFTARDGEVQDLLAKLTERDALLRLISEQPALNPVHRARIKTLISTSAEPSAVGDGVRDLRDYAIEHAGYLVDAADQVLADYQAYSLAQMLENEAGDDGDDEHEEAVDSARNELHEGLANLRSMAYEFRKRRSQAGNVASAESIAPVEPYQGVPGTSFQRVNALANQGE